MTGIQQSENLYVGTLVGESTSREFRLAVAHETIREQDIIAIDAELRPPDGDTEPEAIRIWAKVEQIERVNPLFPIEAGHELAATATDPLDTVLSLSREMVTALCTVLGYEPRNSRDQGKLRQLRYPGRPASRAYRPTPDEIQRIVLGEMQGKRALDIACLANRPEVNVFVDGHHVVTRHLAVLAMTGAGKSWTVRRIIEELARKNYPIVIFDPHGDYTGLGDLPGLKDRVQRYYAEFPIFEEDSETIAGIVSALGYELTNTMQTVFGDLFDASSKFIVPDEADMQLRIRWLSNILNKPELTETGVRPNLWLIANLAEAAELILSSDDSDTQKQQLQEWGWTGFANYNKTHIKTLDGIKKRTRSAAKVLRHMEAINRKVAQQAQPLPTKRPQIVQYEKVSIISLAGYTNDFQSIIFSVVANDLFEARVNDTLKLPVLLVLEEAHNFAPAQAHTFAAQRAINATKQIAQEGRKFGVGLVLISQRPSRLDETTLAMCNSFIIMRMVNPTDQNFIRKVIETLGENDARLLPDLDVGEAVLSGQFVNFPVLVKTKAPESKGEREEQDAFELLEEARRSNQSEPE